MHIVIRIWHFVIKILILVPNTMMVFILHIVKDSHVVVNVASSIEVLRKEIEPHIVPVRWLDLICRSFYMFKVYRKRQMSGSSIEHSHFSLKELILTSIVVSVLISHAQS